jgi:hypothetical protein
MGNRSLITISMHAGGKLGLKEKYTEGNLTKIGIEKYSNIQTRLNT